MPIGSFLRGRGMVWLMGGIVAVVLAQRIRLIEIALQMIDFKSNLSIIYRLAPFAHKFLT